MKKEKKIAIKNKIILMLLLVTKVKKGKVNQKMYTGFFADNSSTYAAINNTKYIWNKEPNMHLTTQRLLCLNLISNYGPEDNEENYKNIVAHELGHCLGLDDSYPEGEIMRTLITDEIGIVVIEKDVLRAYHIMDNGRRAELNYGDVTGNDIEMILQAQSMASHGKNNSYQSYKNYKLYKHLFQNLM